MSDAQFVDFKLTRRGGSLRVRGWREGVTYNALLREGGSRIRDDILGSSVRAKRNPERMRLIKKDLKKLQK